MIALRSFPQIPVQPPHSIESTCIVIQHPDGTRTILDMQFHYLGHMAALTEQKPSRVYAAIMSAWRYLLHGPQDVKPLTRAGWFWAGIIIGSAISVIGMAIVVEASR